MQFNWARERFFDEQVVQTYLTLCGPNPRPTVKSVDRKPATRQRPYAMDTIALEKLGSRKLHLTAKRVMASAEKLYTQGFISYPRTETNMFPADFDLAGLVQAQVGQPAWGAFAQSVLQQQPNGPNPRNGRKSDAAHPPIHPLKKATRWARAGGVLPRPGHSEVPPNALGPMYCMIIIYRPGPNVSDYRQLQSSSSYFNESLYRETFQDRPDDWRVFDLVTRHFLACVSRDARGHETKVTVSVENSSQVTLCII